MTNKLSSLISEKFKENICAVVQRSVASVTRDPHFECHNDFSLKINMA